MTDRGEKPAEPAPRKWRSRVVVSVVAVVALGVTARMLERAGDGSRRPDAPRGAGHSLPGDGESASGPSPLTAGATRSGTEVEPPLTAADVEPNATVAVSGPVRGLLVRVVDGSSGAPIAGVEVVRTSRRRGWKGPGSLSGDVTELRRDALGVFLADEAGEARVPWPLDFSDGDVAFHVESGRRGFVDLDPRSGPEVELRVVPSKRVDVRVIDALGEPAAGVTVFFGRREDGQLRTFLEGMTHAPDGMVTLDGIDLRPRDAHAAEWGVGVRLVAGEEPFVAFEPDAPLLMPIMLRLPATGSVEVKIVDEHGSRVAASGSVSLYLVTADETTGSTRRVGFRIVDGIGRDDRIPLGARFRVQVRAQGMPSVEEVYLDGPRSPGETKLLEFPAVPFVSEIIGRAVRPDGSPCRTTRFKFETSELRLGKGGANELETDKEGRFVLDAGWTNQPAIERGFTLVELPERSARASVAFPAESRPGVLDVGDVVLRTRGVVVAGRVVDDLGRPIANARVGAEFDRELSRAEWESLDRPGSSNATDATGRFVVHGDLDAVSGRLNAREPGHAPSAPVPFASGDREVEIVAARGARLVGSIVTDAGIAPFGMTVDLLPQEAPDDRSRSMRIGEDRGFVFWPLLPGRYDLVVDCNDSFGRSTRLATVAGIDVAVGDFVEDPRLDPIDLRGRLHSLEMKVVDAANGSPLEAVVRLFVPGASVPKYVLDARGGLARFTHPEPEFTADVRAPGRRHVTIEHARGKQVVELAPGLTASVTFRLGDPDAVALLADQVGDVGMFVGVALPEESIVPFALDWLAALVEEDGTAKVTISDAGTWHVHAVLFRYGTEIRQELELGGLRLEVADSSSRDVALPIAFASLRAAIDALPFEEE